MGKYWVEESLSMGGCSYVKKDGKTIGLDKLVEMANENEALQSRVKELEHNLVAWNRSQIKDRNRIKELEQELGEYKNLKEFIEYHRKIASSDTLIKVNQLLKKQAGFKDEN